VAAALDAHGLALAAILVTHHHGDHVGGVNALRPRLQALGGSVYGPAREKIPLPFVALADGDTVPVMGLKFQVIDVPGHTAGHIAYFLPASADGEAPILFCGDTLFSGGCGRLFEGTPAQMSASLAKFAALPADTRVCCTHEYTLGNLKFAMAVEPDNAVLADYQSHCQDLRAKGLPTLPSTIAQERAINPFLRSTQPTVAASAQRFSAEQTAKEGVFAALRSWKNQF
jgi:hydroxyacylglutathione hydrolase